MHIYYENYENVWFNQGGENVMYSLLRMRIAILYEFWLTQEISCGRVFIWLFNNSFILHILMIIVRVRT